VTLLQRTRETPGQESWTRPVRSCQPGVGLNVAGLRPDVAGDAAKAATPAAEQVISVARRTTHLRHA